MDTSTAEVGWVYQDPSNRASWLAQYYQSQNLEIKEFAAEDLTDERIQAFKLIVIEAPVDCTDASTKSLITLVRSMTLVPVQILTVHHTHAQAAELLHLGADDVQSVMTDSRILLAHARALIRRWLTPR
jgi:DNA-binding response OmpR family regulator